MQQKSHLRRQEVWGGEIKLENQRQSRQVHYNESKKEFPKSKFTLNLDTLDHLREVVEAFA